MDAIGAVLNIVLVAELFMNHEGLLAAIGARPKYTPTPGW